MSTLIKLSMPLVLCSMSTVWAQETERQPGSRGDNQQSQGSRASAGNSRGQSSGGRASRGSRNQNSSRQSAGQLDVERGSIPELFSRERNQAQSQGQSAQRNRQGQRQRNGGSRSGSSREFIQNALKFDANADQQLAANELANLFHVLASAQRNQQQFDNRPPKQGQPGGGNLPRAVPATQTTQTTTTNSSSVGTAQSDANFIQRQSVRDALLLFLQLSLRFDTNGDGLLSQVELMGLATALLNNDMGLLNAATQSGGGGTGQQNRTQTTTTTTSQVNRRGQGSQNGRRGGPNRGRPDRDGARPERGNSGRPTDGHGNGRPANDGPRGTGSSANQTGGTDGGSQRGSDGPRGR